MNKNQLNNPYWEIMQKLYGAKEIHIPKEIQDKIVKYTIVQ